MLTCPGGIVGRMEKKTLHSPFAQINGTALVQTPLFICNPEYKQNTWLLCVEQTTDKKNLRKLKHQVSQTQDFSQARITPVGQLATLAL